MASDLVISQLHDGVAVVTLQRPEARNALSRALLAAFEECLAGLRHDHDVHAVVLTGADPAFCAGVDLTELGAGGRDALHSDAVPQLVGLGKPVVAAVNGPAVTGGLELALACDLRIASQRARFADTHARVGLLPGWGLSVRLPQAVGLAWAKQMSFTGQFVGADLALRIGLVNEVVPHERLLARARELAAEMVTANPTVLRRLRGLYDEVAAVPAAQGLAIEQAAYRQWLSGLDTAAVEERRRGIIERGRAETRR